MAKIRKIVRKAPMTGQFQKVTLPKPRVVATPDMTDEPVPQPPGKPEPAAEQEEAEAVELKEVRPAPDPDQGPSPEELLERQANRDAKMAELSSKKKQSERAIQNQKAKDKGDVQIDYAAAKKAYKVARRQYLQAQSGFFHFMRLLRFLLRWAFRAAVAAALLVLVYVIAQKRLVGPGGAGPAAGLHQAIASSVAGASGACSNYVGWAVWTDREKELAEARAETAAAEARVAQITNQLHVLQSQLDESKGELAKEQAASKELQDQLTQAQTANTELKTAKDASDRKVTEKEAALKASLNKQDAQRAEIADLKKKRSILSKAVLKLREQLNAARKR